MHLFFYRRRSARHFVCSSLIVSFNRVNVKLLQDKTIEGNKILISKQKLMFPFGQQVETFSQIFSSVFGLDFFSFKLSLATINLEAYLSV